MMLTFGLACGIVVGWQVRKYRDLPKQLLAKLIFWRRGN